MKGTLETDSTPCFFYHAGHIPKKFDELGQYADYIKKNKAKPTSGGTSSPSSDPSNTPTNIPSGSNLADGPIDISPPIQIESGAI